MFEPLIESRSGVKRRTGGAILSLIVHAMVVAGAVQATERIVSRAGMPRADTLTFVLANPDRAPIEAAEEAPLPGVPEAISEVALPEALAVDIPPVDLGTKPFDPAAVTGRQIRTVATGMAGVIDVSGHVEPGSLRVVSASHPAFVEAAREAIVGGVYRPARYRGAVVRQRVRQRVVFGGAQAIRHRARAEPVTLFISLARSV